MIIDAIRVTGARQNNLRNVAVTIPRRAITAFTGVSGSGKTSLVFDTIAAEAQRQLNETFTSYVRNRLPSLGRPDVEAIDGLSPVVIIDQRRLGGNVRSTVGTVTDIYALLRLLFSRAGTPNIGEATAFSFNDPAGMCLRCSGIGSVVTPVPDRFIDQDRSLEQGAIQLPGFGRDQYWYRPYAQRFPVDRAVGGWSARDRKALLHGGGELEGLVPHFLRIYVNTEASERKRAVLERFTTAAPCPQCHGERLNSAARSVRVAGHSIGELCCLDVAELVSVLRTVHSRTAAPIIRDLVRLLGALDDVGLGYLSLGRPTTTLSGGESQRIKLVRHLGSSLTEMLYVFDEPSVGLHPHDVERLTTLLRQLRDNGNTLLVVEHDPEVVAAADHVVDLGPSAGSGGGRITYQGDYPGLQASDTVTGRALRQRLPVRQQRRTGRGSLPIVGASRHNLRDVTVDIPAGVLTVLTGVAGSGKTSLAAVLLDQHPGGTVIDQAPVSTSRRSNIATYTGIAVPIRRIFAAAHPKAGTSMFTANGSGGCPECRGLGEIRTDLAFLEGLRTVCPVCHGRRFHEEALGYRVDGRSIADVLELTADDARQVFEQPDIAGVLTALTEVGLGYLTLGQPLSTLSGGECQRVKLADELHHTPIGSLYLLDEPTTGLHLADVGRLMAILDRLVEAGNTVVVVEHNLDVIRHADWVIDLGPGAGHHGGRLLFRGTPEELTRDMTSVTGRYLRRAGR